MYTVTVTLTVPAEDADAAIQRVFDAFMSSDIEPTSAEAEEDYERPEFPTYYDAQGNEHAEF